MATKKQVPPPVINRRLLWLASVLAAYALGLLIGIFQPTSVSVFLSILLLIVAAAVALIAWDMWRKEYKAWASRPIRAKQVKKEQVQG